MINYEDFFKVGEEVGFKCRYEYYWVFLEIVFYFKRKFIISMLVVIVFFRIFGEIYIYVCKYLIILLFF